MTKKRFPIPLLKGWCSQLLEYSHGLMQGRTRSIGLQIHQWWNTLPSSTRASLVGVGMVFTLSVGIRLLPYGIPIHSSDIPPVSSSIEFRDRHNLPLGILLNQHQSDTMPVSITQVSPYFIQSMVAAEDQRFYQHRSVDLWAMARAIMQNLRSGYVISGASTITMQLARMIHPRPNNGVGKLQEIWMAWRLEAGMTKTAILEAYFNRLPMGGNIYGIEAAARVYFGVSAKDLTMAQASLLAALPNDPTHLNPYDHWELLRDRQAYVLDRLVASGHLSLHQSHQVFNQTLSLQTRQQGIFAAPHFLFWLRNRLAKNPMTQSISRVQTTLDLSLQRFVETQVLQITRALTSHNVHHGAALVVDNHRGEVLAYVGSPDYFAVDELGRNDGVQALRQPGSTLKPFLYQGALEQKMIRPSSILEDRPIHYPLPGAMVYSPVDYDETHQGSVRVRAALANSLNIPSVKLLERLSVPFFLERLHQLGFTHLNQSADYYGLGLTLGSGEISLWELTQAYLTLARQGNSLPLTPLLSPSIGVTSLPKFPPSPTWLLITDMLSDRHARAQSFGVESVLNLPFPVAVKTGTSSNFRDTWTVGYTQDYTVATWVGNFNGDSMGKVTGVTGAAPLWSRIMLRLHESREPQPFPPPPGLVKRPICATTGGSPHPGCATVQEYFYPEDTTWIQQGGRGGDDGVHGSALRITYPKHQDVFVIDGTSPPSSLQFQVVGSPQKLIEWWLNGKRLQSDGKSTYSWVAQVGEWILQVKSAQGTDEVRFRVYGKALSRPNRGFSRVETNP